MEKKIIGIIGGMGPEAAAHLFLKIIHHTQAQRDQDHFHVIMDSNPQVPDRTAFILEGGESPVPAITAMGETLQNSGARVAGMACITAHYFIEEIRQNLTLPLLDALEETARHVSQHHPSIERVGILATSGTVSTRLFEKYLKAQILYPEDQPRVMEAIYGTGGIKSGGKEEPRRPLLQSAAELKERGAQLFIAGCTEIPLVLENPLLSLPLLDPMDLLAQALIREIGKREDSR